jgi:hypothetical protein
MEIENAKLLQKGAVLSHANILDVRIEVQILLANCRSSCKYALGSCSR